MDGQTARAAFWAMLDKVLELGRGKLDRNLGTEQMPMHLGNVEFWIDDGLWCYDKPVAQWDVAEINRNITFWLSGKAK